MINSTQGNVAVEVLTTRGGGWGGGGWSPKTKLYWVELRSFNSITTPVNQKCVVNALQLFSLWMLLVFSISEHLKKMSQISCGIMELLCYLWNFLCFPLEMQLFNRPNMNPCYQQLENTLILYNGLGQIFRLNLGAHKSLISYSYQQSYPESLFEYGQWSAILTKAIKCFWSCISSCAHPSWECRWKCSQLCPLQCRLTNDSLSCSILI